MSRHVTHMTIDDAEHYTEEQRAEIVAAYPPHEREARTKGVPSMGSGRIFPITEETITCEAFAIPPHWPQLGALDFGWDHPTAATALAWDRDADVIYVTKAYRAREATPVVHAAALRPWGDWLPWAWPHDGLQHDKGSGSALADQYRAQGLKLMAERAHYLTAEGKKESGVEAGIADMLTRMETGRFKVFSHLAEWFAEFRLYHRKDGKVVKMHDDLLSSTRYGVMMLRLGKTKPKAEAPPMRHRGSPMAWAG